MFKGKKSKGFTLIEVMIAVFLLTTALLAAAALTTAVIKGNVFSQKLTTAITLAKDKIEDLKVTPFASLTGGTDAWNAAGTASGSYYTRTWTVTGTDPKTITVTVTRPGNANVELKTIRASD
jgi:prepilin-type N-terminal cleavage/methylation domain-containing protein